MKVSICISVGIYPCHTYVIVGDCLDEGMTRGRSFDFVDLIISDRSPVTIIWSALDPVSFVDSFHMLFLSFHDVVSCDQLICDELLQSVLKIISFCLDSLISYICLDPLFLREEDILCSLEDYIISIGNIPESLPSTWHNRIIIGSLIEDFEEFLRKRCDSFRSEKSLKITRCIVEWRREVDAGIWRDHYLKRLYHTNVCPGSTSRISSSSRCFLSARSRISSICICFLFW